MIADDVTIPDFIRTFSGWSYRMLEDGGHYRLIEAYYGSEGEVIGWVEASAPQGETIEEVRQDMRLQAFAVDHVALERKDLPS